MHSRARSLTRVAKARLLNGGPDTCKRVEREAIAALEGAEWERARQLLRVRVEMSFTRFGGHDRKADTVSTMDEKAEAATAELHGRLQSWGRPLPIDRHRPGLAGAPGQGEMVEPGEMVDVGGHRLHVVCTGAALPSVGLAQRTSGSIRR